jgi:hypothetical protein
MVWVTGRARVGPALTTGQAQVTAKTLLYSRATCFIMRIRALTMSASSNNIRLV